MTPLGSHGWYLDTFALVQDYCAPFILNKNEFSLPKPYFATSQAEIEVVDGVAKTNTKKRRRSSNSRAMTYPTHEYVLPFVEKGFRAFEAVKESTGVCKRNVTNAQQASTAAFPDLVSWGEMARVGKPESLATVGVQDLNSAEISSIFDTLIKNNSEITTAFHAFGAKYIMPPRSAFIMSDIAEAKHLERTVVDGDKYNFVVMDPPWENKSAARAKSYAFLPPKALEQIPLPKLMSDKGTVVAVWITNKVKWQDFIKKELFPLWGIEYLATWYWVKVTDAGELVIPFDNPHRKPYEVIMLGVFSKYTDTERYWRLKELCTEGKVVVSVPTRHSRKPPLHELFTAAIGAELKGLELFARHLIPGFHSWGNEAILFQNEHFFDASTGT